MKVHSRLGMGFKEVVYKDALEIEFLRNRIPYKREKAFKIQYEDVLLRHEFNADFFVYDSIILEIKATSTMRPENFRQTLNYIKASDVKLGILVNFGQGRLSFQRVVCTY